MVQKILHNNLVKKYYSLGIYLSEEGNEYHCIQLKKQKDSIDIISQVYFETEEELLKSVDTSIPFIINFSGSSIIEKTVDVSEGYLEKILFNKDQNQFYINEVFQDASVSISVARKKIIDVILKRLENEDILIIDFTIGVSVLSQMRQIVPEIDTLSTKYNSYSFNTLELIMVNELMPNAEIEIADNMLGSHYFIPFSGFLGYLSKDVIQRNYQQLTDTLEEQCVFKKSLTIVGYVSVAGIFLLLLSSYLVSAIYTEKQLGIETQLIKHNTTLAKISTLNKDIEYKNKVILENSLDNDYYVSQFITEILNNVPDDINTEVFEVFPIIDSKSKNSKIEIHSGLIRILGTTDSQYSVNSWIEILNNLEWVQKTEIETFDQLKNRFNFTINIYL